MFGIAEPLRETQWEKLNLALGKTFKKTGNWGGDVTNWFFTVQVLVEISDAPAPPNESRKFIFQPPDVVVEIKKIPQENKSKMCFVRVIHLGVRGTGTDHLISTNTCIWKRGKKPSAGKPTKNKFISEKAYFFSKTAESQYFQSKQNNTPHDARWQYDFKKVVFRKKRNYFKKPKWGKKNSPGKVGSS